VCLLIAAIVVLDTLGSVAKGGAQTVLWLALVAMLFFVPAGLVIAELGAAFPQEGGPYVWARLAFGRFAGTLVALIYVVETPIWVGGSLAITAVAVVDELIVSLPGGWRVVVALGLVWVTVELATIPLRLGNRAPMAGAAAQVALLAFFSATVVLYGVRNGFHGLAPAQLAPSWPVFMVVAPVLVYNFVGFELPSAAAEELRNPARDIPASILRAGGLTCALYAVPVLAIVLVVPAGQLTGLTGFVKALAGVFVVYGGWARPIGALAAATFICVLIANGLTWTMGASRTHAAASRDGIGPASLARVSPRGIPLAATLSAGWSRPRPRWRRSVPGPGRAHRRLGRQRAGHGLVGADAAGGALAGADHPHAGRLPPGRLRRRPGRLPGHRAGAAGGPDGGRRRPRQPRPRPERSGTDATGTRGSRTCGESWNGTWTR
jgi:amino acid transporter